VFGAWRRCSPFPGRGLILLAVTVVAQGCSWYATGLGIWPPQPPVYWASAFEASVVDKLTGQPIEGVVVLARWELAAPTEGSVVGQMAVMEAVTDEHGRFRFAGWGPRFRPLWGVLWFRSPVLTLVKPGYHFTGRQNLRTANGSPPKGFVRRSDWDGKTIEMESQSADDRAYWRDLNSYASRLKADLIGPECYWTSARRFLSAYFEEVDRINTAAARHQVSEDEPRRLPPTREEWNESNRQYESRCGEFAKQLGSST